eukprot:461892-Lingulodinium_polyedra.AAC.2
MRGVGSAAILRKGCCQAECQARRRSIAVRGWRWGARGARADPRGFVLAPGGAGRVGRRRDNRFDKARGDSPQIEEGVANSKKHQRCEEQSQQGQGLTQKV